MLNAYQVNEVSVDGAKSSNVITVVALAFSSSAISVNWLTNAFIKALASASVSFDYKRALSSSFNTVGIAVGDLTRFMHVFKQALSLASLDAMRALYISVFLVGIGIANSYKTWLALFETVSGHAVAYVTAVKKVVETYTTPATYVTLFVRRSFLQAGEAITNAVRAVSLFKHGISYAGRDVSKFVGYNVLTTTVIDAEAFKKRVVQRIAKAVGKTVGTKRMWHYAAATVGHTVSRIRLAFLVGIRALGRFFTFAYGETTVHVSPKNSQVTVIRENNTIIVPPEESEIV